MEGYYDYHPTAELDRHLVLAGFLTEETRSVGHRLASLIGLPFADLDRKVEHYAGQSTWDLILSQGEAAYRDQERQQLRRALDDTPFGVITLGDGALIDDESQREVVGRATLVVLDLDLAGCYFRYQARATKSEDAWHPLHPGALQSLDQVRPFYQRRRPGFDRAHVKIDLRGKQLSQALDETFEALPHLRPAAP